MSLATNLGFPRIGAHRELKRALEAFWSKKLEAGGLELVARELRSRHWKLQAGLGIDHVPSNDFSLYDHVLDTAVMVGAVPGRYLPLRGDALARYFAMARGAQTGAVDVPAMEMTKWFDTNYHYIVPELEHGVSIELSSTKPIDDYREARALGIETRPVILGPVSFLLLAKVTDPATLDRWLDALAPVYQLVLSELDTAGAAWVQIDEPCLVLDLDEHVADAYRRVYARMRAGKTPRLLVATYFGDLKDNLPLAASLPVDALHVDLVRNPDMLPRVLGALGPAVSLSLGVVDGRNVWKADLDRALLLLREAADALGVERIMVAPSCSLLHTPVDLTLESSLGDLPRSWLAFAVQKLEEVRALATALGTGDDAAQAFEDSRATLRSRRTSEHVHSPAVAARLRSVDLGMTHRKDPYAVRRTAQKSLGLPLLPTTTIGSFPQTTDVRAARAEWKAGQRDRESYDAFLRAEIERAVHTQEEIGLDVLVHGEFERNDMVEYFGERLLGFAFTANGWVQSYGSRCVKPPIIFGDVSRPGPMTVAWSRYAQSLTKLPMKGMLTGPITILEWSFVRDDQPRSLTCRQIALAVRDEVQDLEAAGIRLIQIDEPAIREGLPLRRSEWPSYLEWAVACFRLSSSSVGNETQIHTHMCYSDFNDIIEAVAAMDADVVSIETSRSKMDLLGVFADYRYPNEVGPGVYDIHSPRVPTEAEMTDLLRHAARLVDPTRLWVNPDCGLKTRGWPEVKAALVAMVSAATHMRAELATTSLAAHGAVDDAWSRPDGTQKGPSERGGNRP